MFLAIDVTSGQGPDFWKIVSERVSRFYFPAEPAYDYGNFLINRTSESHNVKPAADLSRFPKTDFGDGINWTKALEKNDKILELS